MEIFKKCINLLNKECKEIISYKLKNKENSKLVFFGVSNLFQRLIHDFLRCNIFPDLYATMILINMEKKLNHILFIILKYYNIKAIYAYNEINYNMPRNLFIYYRRDYTNGLSSFCF